GRPRGRPGRAARPPGASAHRRGRDRRGVRAAPRAPRRDAARGHPARARARAGHGEGRARGARRRRPAPRAGRVRPLPAAPEGARVRAPRVAVVGGGIAGLATAALLARGGARVTLLERHDVVGGRAGTLEVDGFRFDTGPSWYFMPEVFEHFFALLGARVEDHLDLVPLDPAYRVFFEPDGDAPAPAFELSASPGVNRARFDAIEPGAGARLAAYAADASEAYGLALDHFLYTTFERPDRALSPAVLRRLPRLAGLLRESLADRAARAVDDPRLRQLLGYHAVFLGSSPYRAPALYSLMSHLDLVDGVQYPRGGMHTLVEAVERLARAEGVEVRTGADVAE